jgi:hypothetical protein
LPRIGTTFGLLAASLLSVAAPAAQSGEKEAILAHDAAATANCPRRRMLQDAQPPSPALIAAVMTARG